MPELPEVETVKETLKKFILGQTIHKVEVRRPKIVKTNTPEEFNEILSGQKIIDITRRGKFLIFELTDVMLISHLRMEGKYFYRKKDEEFDKHDHIIFYLDDINLTYHDTRQFGTMHIKAKGDELTTEPVSKLGYEPFDENIDRDWIKKQFHKNLSIKALLLDQTILTGLGNIYVDEVCFRLRVHPSTPGKELSHRTDEIIKHSVDVLNKAIALGGTTIRSYTSHEGVTGRFQNELLVHQQKGKECTVCGTIIEKTRVAGRGTYFCPSCQK